MRMHFVVLLFLLCKASSSLVGESTPQWVEVKTAHFTVITDSNEKQGRRVASQFEQMRAVFHTLIPEATADVGMPIVVLALKDKKSFQSIEPAVYLAKGQIDLAGYFLKAPDRVYIMVRLDAQGDHPFSTVYHEYTHLMLSKATWLPLWLNEGLAEFYQNSSISPKEVLLGQPSSDNILYLRDQRLLPLATLFAVDHSSPYYHDEQKGSVFYAESWALTHYIQVSDRENNTHRLEDYARKVQQHEDAVVAAQEIFGDLKVLQKTLDNYISQSAFRMFKLNTAVAIDESNFQARPLSTPQANAVRADLLVDNDRRAEALTLLTATLAAEPNNEMAHEAMGTLKFREGDTAAARQWYGEAVQLDSQSYLAHYYYAVMSLQAGDSQHDAVIESSLQAAIKLQPGFAPPYDALASFYASRHNKLPEAHHLNIVAIQLDPANIEYRRNAALVLEESGQLAGAIGILQRAVEVAKNPEEISSLNVRIAQLQKFKRDQDSAQPPNDLSASHEEVAEDRSAVTSTSERVTFRKVDGKMIGMKDGDSSAYPPPAQGAKKHSLDGILRGVECSAPSVMVLSVEQAGKQVRLYTNNFYKLEFSFGNYSQTEAIKPCTDIEGMKAHVAYEEVQAKTVAGQLLSIELNR